MGTIYCIDHFDNALNYNRKGKVVHEADTHYVFDVTLCRRKSVNLLEPSSFNSYHYNVENISSKSISCVLHISASVS
jgi:hypothetical protein